MESTFISALAIVFSLSAIASAEVHKATVSPSGRYKLASQEIKQKGPDGSQASIGSNISLIGRDGAVISKCFSPSEAYIDVDPDTRGSDDWQTKAYWNDDETMVAVYSGGRTWSKIDFYSITEDRIAILPHPNWVLSLFKDVPGYKGETTRLYEGFLEWLKNDTCRMKVGGTFRLDDSQKEQYPQFDYIVTMRITLGGIEIIEMKNGNT